LSQRRIAAAAVASRICCAAVHSRLKQAIQLRMASRIAGAGRLRGIARATKNPAGAGFFESNRGMDPA
jgi:hypothetical protein